jgi:hypothetical protein
VSWNVCLKSLHDTTQIIGLGKTIGYYCYYVQTSSNNNIRWLLAVLATSSMLVSCLSCSSSHVPPTRQLTFPEDRAPYLRESGSTGCSRKTSHRYYHLSQLACLLSYHRFSITMTTNIATHLREHCKTSCKNSNRLNWITPTDGVSTLSWWWVECSRDSESYAGGSVATGRSTHAGKVKG